MSGYCKKNCTNQLNSASMIKQFFLLIDLRRIAFMLFRNKISKWGNKSTL